MKIAMIALAACVLGLAPLRSAEAAVACKKVTACVNGSCTIYIVCQDGTIYQV